GAAPRLVAGGERRSRRKPDNDRRDPLPLPSLLCILLSSPNIKYFTRLLRDLAGNCATNDSSGREQFYLPKQSRINRRYPLIILFFPLRPLLRMVGLHEILKGRHSL